MSKRKKKAPTFRTLITKRIAKAGNKKDALSELRKQRERDQKALKKLNASIEREERRLTKAKRALSRAKLKKLKTQKAQHKRRLKTLANIRKVVTERRNKRGRKTQRKSKFTDVARFSGGKKYGDKRTYEFTKYNHKNNYISIDYFLNGLRALDASEDKTTYVTILIKGKLKKQAMVKVGRECDVVKPGKNGEPYVPPFNWYNLLRHALHVEGINVDVNSFHKGIEKIVNEMDWAVWKDSRLPQILVMSISTSETPVFK